MIPHASSLKPIHYTVQPKLNNTKEISVIITKYTFVPHNINCRLIHLFPVPVQTESVENVMYFSFLFHLYVYTPYMKWRSIQNNTHSVSLDSTLDLIPTWGMIIVTDKCCFLCSLQVPDHIVS